MCIFSNSLGVSIPSELCRSLRLWRISRHSTVGFESLAGPIDVSLEHARTEPRRLTCHAVVPLSAPSYRLLAIESWTCFHTRQAVGRRTSRGA
jgi:hypothetical protein